MGRDADDGQRHAAVARQLAEAVGLHSAATTAALDTPGDVVNALAGVALQALTALTARRQQAAGCHLDPSKRLHGCQLLQQLLEMPAVAAPTAMPQQAHSQQPVAATQPSTQALFQQVLAQLPGIALPQQEQQQQPTPPGTVSRSAGSLLSAIQQQQPGLMLAPLLSAAGEQLQEAVQAHAAPAKWASSQEWLLGQQLLQVAGAIAEQAVQQQLGPLSDSSSGSSAALEASCSQLCGALSQAMTAAEGAAAQGMTAALAAVKATHELLQACAALGALSKDSCTSLQGRLLRSLLPTATTSSSSSSLSQLLSQQGVLQPAAATALQQSGLQTWPPQRLLLVAQLLGGSSWAEVAEQLAAAGQQPDSSSLGSDVTCGWDTLLHLTVLVLQAVAEVQAAAAQASKAAADAAAKQAARAAASEDESASEPDYFQDIFGSDDATPHSDDARSSKQGEAANKNSATYEQAVSELAAVLMLGLAKHLSRTPRSVTWGVHDQQALQLAVCCVGLDLAHPQQPTGGQQQETTTGEQQASDEQRQQQQEEDEEAQVVAAAGSSSSRDQDLVALQQSLKAAVQHACCSCVPAAQQLVQTVLLARTGPSAAGHARPAAVLQLAGQVVLQQAAALATRPGEDSHKALLLAPWLHMASQLVGVTEKAVAAAAADGDTASSMQEDLVWLLCPGRLSVVMATALAVSAADRALLAAIMLHSLGRCSQAMAAAVGAAATPQQASCEAASTSDSDSDSTPLVGGHALAMSAMHACLSMLLWLLLPPALLPTAWLQQHLQHTLQQDVVAADDGEVEQQQQQQFRPVGLVWVAALLQYKYPSDELPLLLESLGATPVESGVQDVLASLLPGFVPSCLPCMAADSNAACMQVAVQAMQQPEVLEAACALLQQHHQQQQQVDDAASSSAAAPASDRAWQLTPASPSSSQGSSSNGAAHSVVQQLLDSVLPGTAAAWSTHDTQSSDGSTTSSSTSCGVAMAVAYSCCYERAMQLMLVVQQQQQQPDTQGGFNTFGTCQHLVRLQQQLLACVGEYEAGLEGTDSSSRSQLVPCQLSLHASGVREQPQQPLPLPQQQQPAVAAVADKLGGMLAAALEDAIQRFQLSSSEVSTPVLLKQQLHTWCAEMELLGHTLQAARVLLLPHLPRLLPLLSQLQWQVTDMQLRCLAAALNSCCSQGEPLGAGSTSAVQLLLTLCTDADYAADAVDAVHEGLGYCLLATLTEPQGQCWPSRADPVTAVKAALKPAAGSAAVASQAPGGEGGSAAPSSVESAAAQAVLRLMQPFVASEQQQGRQGEQADGPLFVQELNLVHGCLPAVPLPQFWSVGCLNRASGSIAGAGAALAAAAAAVSSATQQDSTGSKEAMAATGSDSNSSSSAASAAAAVADWMQSMGLLELQRPLLMRAIQQQHAHLLQEAASLATSAQEGEGDTTAAACSVSGGVAAVCADVSAAFSSAIAAAAASTGTDGQADEAQLDAARALAAAAVVRLQDVAEGSGSYHAAAVPDGATSASSSIGGQLVDALIQQQPGADGSEGSTSSGEGSVLQQLWQCTALGVLDSSRVLDLLQQVTGTLHGSDDTQAQQLHDQLLEALRGALLQLPQEQFERLLQRQLSVKTAFLAAGSGVALQLWQQLLTTGRAADAAAAPASAVQLLRRILDACLHLTFTDTQQSHRTSSSGGLSKQSLSAVSMLLGVVVQCATSLGLPGVLACLQALQGLAAACTGCVTASKATDSGAGGASTSATTTSSSSGDSSDNIERERLSGDALTQRLVVFLPLLLFVQRVVSQAVGGSGSSSDRGRGSSGRAPKKSGSVRSSSSRGELSEPSEGYLSGSDGEQHSSSSIGIGAATTQQQPQQQQQQSSADVSLAEAASDASTGMGPFEAAAHNLVLQDEALQVVGASSGTAGGGGGYDVDEEEDEFLDEFEDEDAYLVQLVQQGALAAAGAAAAAGAGAGGGGSGSAGQQQQQQAVGGGDGDEDSDDTSSEDESSLDGEDAYHDAEEGSGGGGEASAADAGRAAAASNSPSTGQGGGNGGGAAAAAAAASAASGLQGGVGAGDDGTVLEDEQALLDEEFAALLHELLAAGAAPDVALAAVTAATGMGPPPAAVSAATDAAAASGDEEMIAVVEQLAAAAASATAAAANADAQQQQQPASTAATSLAASPVAAARQTGDAAAGTSAGAGGSSSSRRRRQRRNSSGSSCSHLPQLRRYWQRSRQQDAASSPSQRGEQQDSGSSPLADSLQCTYALHGDQFVEQHWYQCITCGLTDSRGCCSACVRVCHAGHEVVYAAKSRFFCDCGGESGPRDNAVACKCLLPVPVHPSAAAAAASSGTASTTTSTSSLTQQGWLLPPLASNPLSRTSLASSLRDPLDSAWSFDPQLYPGVYAAATNSAGSGSGSGSSSSSSTSASVRAAERVLQNGGWAGGSGADGQAAAAALKLVPQGLVAKAARALKPWVSHSSSSDDDGAADKASGAGAEQQQQQGVPGAGGVLQAVASSTLQLSQLLLQQLLHPSSRVQGASGGTPTPTALPAVLRTTEMLTEASGSSTSTTSKETSKDAGKAGSASTAASSSTAKQQQSKDSAKDEPQRPLLDLQRVIRLGNMHSSSHRSRTRSGSDYGSAGDSSGGGGSRGPEVPAEVAAALEGGLVCQQSAAAAMQGQLLAVCRGESVGLMDGRLLGAELCGRDIFTKEEISAAVAATSKALSPNQASGGGGGGGTSSSHEAGTSSGSGGGGASSYFYVRRHSAKFHVLAVHWDLLQGRRLLVVGYQQAQVWSVEARGLTISDRLVLQLPALVGEDEAGRLILSAAWLPGSDTWVAVSTPLRVYLFDLAHSASAPAVVIEPQGHVLLAGGAAFVPRLVLSQPQQQEQQQQAAAEGAAAPSSSLQQQLYAMLLTRDGQLLSAEVPVQLLQRQQSCASHWPRVSCVAAEAQTGAAGSSAHLTAEPVEWPAGLPQLSTGRTCHWLPANALLVVAGTGNPPSSTRTSGEGSAATSSSSASEKGQAQGEQQQQLLLQLDATCRSVLQACSWQTSEAAMPVLGSPKPLVLSPSAVYWDLPLLPAARSAYGAAQLFAVAPGQATQLLQGTGSSGTTNGSTQGCTYVAALQHTTTSGWTAAVQPLHLRHSSAGAVVDGLAVLSFPYTQQLLLVVLCSKGNMYMFTTRRPPGLQPLQPFTQLLRKQLTYNPDQQEEQQQQSGSSTTPAAAGAAAGSESQRGVHSRRAAAMALAAAGGPDGSASGDSGGDGSTGRPAAVLAADDSALLLQSSTNITSHLSVSGDISRAGSADAAARALFKTLADPERRLEAPEAGATMTLVIKVAAACELQPVGLKLLLPGAGVAPASVKITCGDAASSSRSNGGSGAAAAATGSAAARPNSIAAIAAAARTAARSAAASASQQAARTISRTVQLAGGGGGSSADSSSSTNRGRSQRWYQVIFTPQESVAAAAAGEFTLMFSAALDPDRRAALCHLDVFGQPADTVADRERRQQTEQEQVLAVDVCCAAAAAAVPAVLAAPAASAAEPDRSSAAPSGCSQLLLNTLLQAGAAASACALHTQLPATEGAAPGSSSTAASDSSSELWEQQVVPVMKQLLCPDAQAAASWTPSWQCEAAAHQLLITALPQDDSSTAALALKDEWRLCQAAAVLQTFAATCVAQLSGTVAETATAEGSGSGVQLDDAAVYNFLHAMGQLQSVLQARPDAVVNFLRNHSSTSKGGRLALPAAASIGLQAAVFALKQLSGGSSGLLPAELLSPLVKTAVELWVAHACASQEQQQQQEAVQGVYALLACPDEQLRVHAAAAWLQTCTNSSAEGAGDSRGVAGSVQCGLFVGVAKLLVQQQQFACSQLLAAFQAAAGIARHLVIQATPAAEGDGAVQAVASVVATVVQQLQQLLAQDAVVAPSATGLFPEAAERILVLQLLLTDALGLAVHQQRQPAAAASSGGGSSSVPPQQQQSKQHKQPQLHRQLLPPRLLQLLSAGLLQMLQAVVPLLQSQAQVGLDSWGPQQQQQQSGLGYAVIPGEGSLRPGPGGFVNYQALLSPPALVNVWGMSASCCSALLGVSTSSSAGVSSSGVPPSGRQQPAGTHASTWLLDPFVQGDASGTRLLQALPLQLAAVGADLAHMLLQYGLVQTVGRATPAHMLRIHQQQPSQAASAQDSSKGASSAAVSWCSVMCSIMDMPLLLPVRRLAKQVVVDLSGSSTAYKEVRSLHLLRKHTADLLGALGLQQQQQQQQQQSSPSSDASAAVGVVADAVAALQASWQQQCVTAACLAQLLSVAESQPVAWAQLCTSSSSGNALVVLLPLLMQMAVQCKQPQLSVTAIKLFNAALSGVVKAAAASSSGSSRGSGSSSSSSKGKSAATSGSASGGGSKSSKGDTSKASSSKRPAGSVSRLQVDLGWLVAHSSSSHQEGPSLLSAFIDSCVVGWPEGRERREAAKTLVLLHKALGVMGGSQHHHSSEQARSVLTAVLQAVPAAGPAAGGASLHLFSAASQLVKQSLAAPTGGPGAATYSPTETVTASVTTCAARLFATIAAASSALSSHPCSVAYQHLQGLLEFQQPGSSSNGSASGGGVGYWLEVSGCDVATGRLNRKPPNTTVRLDGIASELKYGDKQVMARLSGWYSVHRLMLVVHSPRRSKTVASLRLWYCDSPVSELQQLKQQQGAPAMSAPPAAAAVMSSSSSSRPTWKLGAADVLLSPGQTEVTVDFELPLLANCLMVEFTGFHASVNESATEVLHCPRCSHVVTDKHGLCGYCRENAYQCRQCRHINYEAPDAFICSECGHSRYGRFELLLQAVKAPGCPPLLAHASTDDALSALDTSAAAAASKMNTLQQAVLAVQQQAATLATSGFSLAARDAAASAATAGASSVNRRGSGGDGGSSAESLMKPAWRQLAQTYTERCKPAFEEALQAARVHAAVRASLAEAEASGSSSTSSSAVSVQQLAQGAQAEQQVSFSNCSYGHTVAVLSAAVSLLSGVLAAAPSAVTEAAGQQQGLRKLLALLQPSGSNSSRTLVPDVRSMLLGLAKADVRLHRQLLDLLQEQLVLPAADTHSSAAAGSLNASLGAVLGSHELQLLLLLAEHDVQQLGKQLPVVLEQPAAGEAAEQHARAPRLVLQLLQRAVVSTGVHGLCPDLLLTPGLKVLVGAAGVQRQLEKSLAEQAEREAKEAAAAAKAAEEAAAAAAAAAAAVADSVVDVGGADRSQPVEPTTTSAAETEVYDATVLDDAEAERLEQLKIAEYLSRRGSSGSSAQQQHPQRSLLPTPGYMPRQQQPQRQRSQPLGYGQSPLMAQQQAQLQQRDQQGTGGAGELVAALSRSGSQRTGAAWSTNKAAPGGGMDSKQQQGAKQKQPQQQADSTKPAAAAAAAKPATPPAKPKVFSEVIPLPALLHVAEQLVLHPHSSAVRKEATGVLLQLQPDPLQRLQRLQQLLPDACRASEATGTELVALLMETVAQMLVQCSQGSSNSTSGGCDSHNATSSAASDARGAQQQQDSSGARSHASSSDGAADKQLSPAAVHAALNGLLAVCCQALVQQVSRMLQQEQQLYPVHHIAPVGAAVSAVALQMLLEVIEQLLVGVAQLQQQQQQHHHEHHHHHRQHQHQHPQQQASAQPLGWVDAVCLQQLLWAVGGLDALNLTGARSASTTSAAQQLHRLVKQGWLEGGAAGESAAGLLGHMFGDSAGEDDETYFEDEEEDEYETDEDGVEEQETSEHVEGGQDAAAAAGSPGRARQGADSVLLSTLPALPEAVLAQRRNQLVEALVGVLAVELQRISDPQQQPQQQPGASGPAAAAAGLPLSSRSSLAVCSALIALLASAVTPEKPAPTYQLLLEKAATQEEFIPGQLPSGGLVTSAALAAAAATGSGGGGTAGGGQEEGAGGPLMRDVKNYVCRRLDMTGLVDDDFGMELLVGGSIISLALPVLDVIQHHWWALYQQQGRSGGGLRGAAAAGGGSGGGGSGGQPLPPPNIPMPVTFRLSGLDGEATEPVVKDLNPKQAAGQNPDEQNEQIGVLAQGQGTGLGLLLQLLLLAHQQPVRALRRVSGQLLQLLKAAVGQADCRKQLLQHGALGCLLHLVHLACKPLLAASSSKQGGAAADGSARPAAASVPAPTGALGCGITGAQLLLLLECLQQLVEDANRSGQPVNLTGAIAPAVVAAAAAPAQQGVHEPLAAAPSATSSSSTSSSTGSSSGSLSGAAQQVSSSSTEVAQLADGLSVLESVGLGSCAAVLAKLLTALAQHSSTAQLGLLTHFAPALDLQALDDAAAQASSTGVSVPAGVAAVDSRPASAAASAGGEDMQQQEEGEEEEDGEEEVVLLSAVHSEAGRPMSAHEHRLQLKGLLRLIEALTNSTSPSSTSDSGASADAGSQSHFKQLVLQQGVPDKLAAYLLACFTPPPPADTRSSPTSSRPATPASALTAAQAASTQLLQPGSEGWSTAAARPGVPFALQLLTALAHGHAATASALAANHPSLLQLLHLLEGTAGGSTITPLAEACLEALAGSGAAGVGEAVSALRAATAAEMRAKAAKKRQALLASLGMVQIEAAAEAGGGVKILPSPGGVPALSPLAAELAALEGSVEDDDDGGAVCMVCREGYTLQPTTLLGCYCFCRVAAAAEWPGCGPPWGTPHDLLLTTVSHFNLIHVNCHAAAKAADASLRQPKREWAGATLRNGNVLCNSLLPLAAGKAETAYAAAVTTFWQQQLAAPSSREAAAAAGGSGGGGGSGSDGGAVVNVAVSLSRRSAALREADTSLLRVSLVAADLATLLWRFTAQLSFSEEARGGGRASNARLLFVLMQLGRYYVVEAPTADLQRVQKLMAAATGAAAALGLEAVSGAGAATPAISIGGRGSGAASNTAAAATSCSTDDLAELAEHTPFVLALSLLYLGPSEWMAARRSMLTLAVRAGVSRVLQQAAAEASVSSGSSSSHRRSSSGTAAAASATAAAAASAATSAASLSDEALYAAAAPMLRLFGFVDWLHQWAKPSVGLSAAGGSSGSAASSSSTSGSGGSSGWGAAMAQQLQDVRGCSEAATELLGVVDEAEGALGLQDLLDGFGVLGVVLGPKSSSCEEFLRQAVAGL